MEKAEGSAPADVGTRPAPTTQLEKRKRKAASKAGGVAKRSRTSDILFGTIPRKANGDSEGAPKKESSPIVASPVNVAPPLSVELKSTLVPPSLDCSDPEEESDEDVDILTSPVGEAKASSLMITATKHKVEKSISSSDSSGSSSTGGSDGRSSTEGAEGEKDD